MSKIIINQEATFVSDGNDIVDTLDELTDVNITSVADQQILKYDSATSKWINGASTEVTALNELSDVTITGVTNGELLVYNSTSGEWENGTVASTITSIDNLGDVSITSAANGDLLVYNSTSGEWENVSGYDTATNIIASIVDSAPTTLDTLNELAAALGDDPNFATTTAASLALKLEDITGESIWDLNDVSTSGRTSLGALSWNGTNVVANDALLLNQSSYNTMETLTNNRTLLLKNADATNAQFGTGITMTTQQPNTSNDNKIGTIEALSLTSGYGSILNYFTGNSVGDSTQQYYITDGGTQTKVIEMNTGGVEFSLPPVLPAYTVAALPSASAGSLAAASDDNYEPYYYDGSQWINLFDVDGGTY